MKSIRQAFQGAPRRSAPKAKRKWLKVQRKWLKAKAHEVPKRVIKVWNRYLARDPPSFDSGIPLSETDAKTMMDKIEARSKWLKANGKGKWLKAKAHEVPKHVIKAWKRSLARDPPSYDSGTLLSEADAKTMMDKIEARTKWLKANGKAPPYLGKHQRVILARAKSKADVTMDATTHKPSDVDGHRP